MHRVMGDDPHKTRLPGTHYTSHCRVLHSYPPKLSSSEGNRYIHDDDL